MNATDLIKPSGRRHRVDFVDAKGNRWCWSLLGDEVDVRAAAAAAAARHLQRDGVRVDFDVREERR